MRFHFNALQLLALGATITTVVAIPVTLESREAAAVANIGEGADLSKRDENPTKVVARQFGSIPIVGNLIPPGVIPSGVIPSGLVPSGVIPSALPIPSSIANIGGLGQLLNSILQLVQSLLGGVGGATGTTRRDVGINRRELEDLHAALEKRLLGLNLPIVGNLLPSDLPLPIPIPSDVPGLGSLTDLLNTILALVEGLLGGAIPSGVIPSGIIPSGVIPSGVIPSGVVPSALPSSVAGIGGLTALLEQILALVEGLLGGTGLPLPVRRNMADVDKRDLEYLSSALKQLLA